MPDVHVLILDENLNPLPPGSTGQIAAQSRFLSPGYWRRPERTAQSFLPEGYMTTSFRTSFARKMMVVHQAKSVGNLDAPRGCRTQLIGEVRGDIGKLFTEWDHFGWHRVTVYGDVREPLIEMGRALGLEIIEEA